MFLVIINWEKAYNVSYNYRSVLIVAALKRKKKKEGQLKVYDV